MLPVVNVRIHRPIVRQQQNLIKPLEILIQPLNEMIKTRLFIQLAAKHRNDEIPLCENFAQVMLESSRSPNWSIIADE